jgi:hypothetical protein
MQSAIRYSGQFLMTGIFITILMMILLASGNARALPGTPSPGAASTSAQPVGIISPSPPPLPSPQVLRQWIAEMKNAPRGPFQRIRWFCRDGSVRPPQAYACRDYGGGVQHGEWNTRVKLLRSHGYMVANVLADLDPGSFGINPDWLSELKQMILEQFLIEADDGWIFRQARFYPGALQSENENESGRALLLELLADRSTRIENFLVLREAARLLPHGRRGAPFIEMRQMARAIEDLDPGFTSLRVKLHIRPDAGDAERVRNYAAEKGKPELAGEYRRLAEIIDQVYQPRDLAGELNRAAAGDGNAEMARLLRQAGSRLAVEKDPFRRFVTVAAVMQDIRGNLSRPGNARQMLEMLDLSLDLEHEAFQLGNAWLENLPRTDRLRRLDWLQGSCRVIYGIGLISHRELDALDGSILELRATTPLPARTYKAELDYLSRIPAWSENTLHCHFRNSIDHLATLDPLFDRYIPDRLRGSPLVCLITVLDSLNLEAGGLVGIRHEVFGAPVNSGLRVLNPGLARGPLRLYRPGSPWDRTGIYLLPETLADLPPLAGILTEGGGNSLSHVQLLARNLGIPNVSVEHRLAGRLSVFEGEPVVLAASPGGVVELSRDGPRWDEVFQREQATPDVIIRPDLNRLDLNTRMLLPLRDLRRADSGRIVGPKAANLGELKNLYPDLVTEGLVLPFGIFRSYLDQPIEPGGPSVFQWMREQYAAIQRVADPGDRASAAAAFLQHLRSRIITGDPGQQLRQHLESAMDQTFGPGGSYGVFVRSDTNVEDLPGFTGAGLNLTLPNVVGFENVLRAILQVWASPFTERAYGWRQAHMERPEEVYVSVLLLKSVPAEKSGVMVTADVETGDRNWLTVAVNEGVGGAVEGQRAEELLIEKPTGRVRLLAQAAEPLKRILRPEGGVTRVPASGTEEILSVEEIRTLLWMADSLPGRFPGIVDAGGNPAPADIEFGFSGGHLALFQIRPFLESSRAARSRYLHRLDEQLEKTGDILVDLHEIPREDEP